MPLTERERLQRCRDPNRLRSSQLIERVLVDFIPAQSPDPALITGVGNLGDLSVLVFAQEKPRGRDAKQAADVNYGMMSATGYWHVIEQLDRVNHASQAVLFLIDTPGADPSKEGSENLLAWAISSCTRRLLTFAGSTVSLVLGEGGSGGALAMQVADRRLMMHDAIYSTISPESCSAILFRTPDKIDEAMGILRPSAEQMLEVGIVDEVVTVPDSLVITQHAPASHLVGERLRAAFAHVRTTPAAQRVRQRCEAYLRIGRTRVEQSAPSTPRVLPVQRQVQPPPLEKFAHLSRDDDHLSTLRNAYYLAKGARLANAAVQELEVEADMVCPRDRGGCGVMFSRQAYTQAHYACPSCGRGDRLASDHWLALLCKDAPFEELFADLDLGDLEHAGYDTPAYQAQRKKAREQTGVGESMRVGIGVMGDMRVAMALSDFRFLGGTLGAVAGEKLWLICQIAREEQLPLLSVTCSGGVRMQDGTLGLAQMAKSVAAVNLLIESNLPYVSILADPCTGGALGSYATVANGVLAEPAALIAFAGPRVMRMAGLPLNEQAMLSNRFVEYGGVDEVVPRTRMALRAQRYLQLKPMLRRQHHKATVSMASAPESDITGWFDDLLARASAVLQDSNGASTNKTVLVSAQATVVARLADLALISVPLLLEQASGSANARVRANAVEALARFPGLEKAQLLQALQDDHHRVRANAAVGLLRRYPSEPETLATLQGLLGAADSVARRSALFALTRAPHTHFHAQVVAFCDDGDVLVRLAAAIALFSYRDVQRGRVALMPLLARLGVHAARKTRQMLQFMPEETAKPLRQCLEDVSA